LEKVGKIPMLNLSENAERIWKVLSQFPKGTTAKSIEKITSMGKSTVYKALDELREKGFDENKYPLWMIKEKTSNAVLRDLLKSGNVSERLLRRHLEKNPEIRSLIGEFEQKFGRIADIREEILNEGSDVVLHGFADNFSEKDVKQSIERERLRRLLAEKIEDLTYPV
jgi:hypothetical protein